MKGCLNRSDDLIETRAWTTTDPRRVPPRRSRTGSRTNGAYVRDFPAARANRAVPVDSHCDRLMTETTGRDAMSNAQPSRPGPVPHPSSCQERMLSPWWGPRRSRGRSHPDVLRAIQQGASYGYQIHRLLRDTGLPVRLNHLYLILRRMEKDGLVPPRSPG